MKAPPFTHGLGSRIFWALLGIVLFATARHTSAADKTVRLVVTVKEDDGSTAIGSAHVNVYQANRAGSDWIARPPDYQQDTNVKGVARFEIKVKRGESLKLSIEASREDKVAQRDDVDLGANFPPQVLRQFFLKPRITENADTGATTSVKVRVKRKDNQQAVEGATVEVASIGGLAAQRSSRQTDTSGEATILMPASRAFEVSATKELFGSASQRVTAQEGQRELGPVELSLERQRGTEVRVVVTDDRNGQGVGDARVIFDGPQYQRTTTDASGHATLTVPESGSYSVRVQQQYYENLNDQMTIAAGEELKDLSFSLTAKDKKQEEKDTVEVTVFARDPADKDSKRAPLRGAEVTVGRYTVVTDENGHATVTGSYNIREEVTARANGYKPQTKTVGLNKLMRYAAGKGTATFTLEPLLSETDPVKLVVVVRDTADRAIPQAGVEFLLPDGTWLWGAAANAKGERDFVSTDIPNLDSEAVRKGIKVQVKKTGYKEHESLVSADLLQPSSQARRYLVQLDKDWTELTKAIVTLEERIGFWKSDAQRIRSKAQSVESLSTKSAAAQGKAESLLGELKAARQAAATKQSGDGCREAKELTQTIEKWKDEALEKEKQLRTAVDEATSLAGNCKSKADADAIRSKHKDAIVLTGELGKLDKQARLANQKLTILAQGLTDAGPVKQLQELVDKIETEISGIGKDAATADNDFNDAVQSAQSLPGRRAELLESLDRLRLEHHVREDERLLPADLRTRLESLEAVLRAGGNDLSLSFAPTIDRSRLNVIKEAVSRMQEYKNQATEIVSSFKLAMCEVRPLDYMVEGIGSTVVGATIELAAASDLAGKAAACDAAVAAAASTPSPTPDDEVTVPDVSIFAGVGEMKAAASQAGLVPALVATKATPPPGSTLLFARQDPLAKTRAKKGSPLRIFLYQQVAQPSPSPSPTPTPSPVPKPSPSPTESDEVRVPDLSIFDGLVEMKAAASQVGLVPALAATKATPPPDSTRLFAGQDPTAGSKAKRGSILKILVYQKSAESAAASPTPSATPQPTAIATNGNMPSLIGLTLDQAVSRLTSNMRIGSDEIGDKPPSASLALTIFAQNPAAGSRVDLSKPVVISVKRYGSAQAATAARFDGTYVGSYSGADSGRVRFTVSGGSISISSPGSGSGQVSSSGSANISGAGTDSSSSYSFSGTFSVSSDGKASASGRWSGKQQGYTGSGTWRASRP